MNPLAESILCRAQVQLAPTATGEMMYMPGGLQTINPFDGGMGQPITVRVDAAGAAQLNEQHAALLAKGKRPYFDFNHEDGEASFWPAEYVWKDAPEPAIYARGEWSADGKSKVEGKAWRQFSPVFHVEKKLGTSTANPTRIIARAWAKPNMGGLVNDPAFHTISPLWARDHSAGAAGRPPNHNQTSAVPMNEQEQAALRAKNLELQTEIDALKARESALKAKNETDAAIAAELRAKQLEIDGNNSKLELEALKAKNTALEAADKTRRETHAKAFAADMVKRGALAAKDAPAIAEVEKNIAENAATFEPIYAKWAGSPALTAGRLTQSSDPNVAVIKESPNAVMKEYGRLICANAKIPNTHQTHQDKGKLAREAAALFAKEMEKDPVIVGMSIDEALKAADFDDPNNQVGLLSGSLVLQKSLPLLQYKYPILRRITQDFSDAPGLYNQTEVSRIVITPAVQNYVSTLGTDGRPLGWTTSSPAQTVDVPVTLSNYIGVPIVFGVTQLTSTIRNLFGESANQAIYAIGGNIVQALAALFTAPNFNAYAGSSLAAGATNSGSPTITVTSTADCYPGQAISGTGIPANTFILNVANDGVTLTLSANATATNTGLTLTVGTGKVPNAYATYVQTLADFNFASLGNIGAAFDTNEVPDEDRFALLNSSYYQRLAQDPTFNTFFAAMQNPEIITKGQLPELNNFMPTKAAWFPTSSNRVGFAGHRAAAIVKTRLPQSGFLSAVSASPPGSISTVTDPGTGISVALVQLINLYGNYAEWRPEVMHGEAIGDRRCGMVITSQ